MDFPTQDSLKSSLVSTYQSSLNIDLTEGTPEREVFVEAPVTGQLLDIWNALSYLYMLEAPFIYSDKLLVADLDTFCKNNGVASIPATYSTGTVIFYTTTEPTKDIVITNSNSVSTGNGLNYTVNGYYTLPYLNRSNYYSATSRRWQITVNVTAQTAGSAGTCASLAITNINGSISGIEGVTNTDAITGGTDAGTIQQRLALVQQNFKGRNLATLNGIQTFVNGYSQNAVIVGSNSPLMLRTGGIGGGIDIYIRDGVELGTSDTVTITSTGLNTLINPTYTTTTIIMQSQPVSLISTVTKNGVELDTSYYTLTKDTGLLYNSTIARDCLTLTPIGIVALGVFKIGDVIAITYNYNSLLHTIEDALNSSNNLYDNRSFVLREQSYFTIDVYMQVSLLSGYTIADIISASSLTISNYIDTNTASYIELATIFSIVKTTAGVDNANLTTAYITPSDGRAKTAAGDIPINSSEYCKSGNINLVVWAA